MKHFVPCAVLFALLWSCNTTPTRFELLSSGHTGITFNNLLTESDTLNVLSFEYMYNGGGVGTGDFNNDGLTDIFMAGNMVTSKLYLNKGSLAFDDITQAANVETKLWCTGVSVVDIDQDGRLDIYVCTVNPHDNETSPNLLFHNKGNNANGVPQFEEVAARVGLADQSYSTQAAFLDYDRDGDLDMYLLTNALENYSRNSPIGQRKDGTGKSVDKFFRNEGVTNGLPQFKDVSAEAGILTEGWGLGIVVNDLNRDGFPDVYVANDFLSNDHVFINTGQGAFVNEMDRLRHQEYNGMGADIGDINNDGLNDIVVVDMMPEDNLRQKTMFPTIAYDRFHKNIQMKYSPQYVRNVLQLNNGNGTFSDIGYLSGIYATDWSWSALMADLDNDGWQDVLITNGYRKDITNLDFVAYSKESSMFGTDATRLKKLLTAVNEIEGVKKPDLLFRNNGDLRFTNKSAEWGMVQEAYGNGAAYADLDNDGDLDLVINNINDEAFLYRNNTVEMGDGKGNYLRVAFKGPTGNANGLGTKVEITSRGKKQYREYQVQRGYQSSVESYLHFGLDTLNTVDTLSVVWPDGKSQILTNVKANQVIALDHKNAGDVADQKKTVSQPFFVNASATAKLQYKHSEPDYIDFKSTATLPQKYSQAGPGISVGDVNGDGLEDVVLCGPAQHATLLFYQQKNGTFKRDSLSPKTSEDMSMLLFDADQDNDLDLYCVSGSSEFGLAANAYQDRFYRNTGNKLVQDTTALPKENSSGSTVTACDFDHDGDVDLFVGGRISPLRYPEAPQSMVLQNEGKGKFTDVTSSLLPALRRVGMVTASLWTDFDNDGWTDLALVGEWMPVSFFKNNGGKSFSPAFADGVGWWSSIVGGDFDNDGDTDYVCGNLGLNSLFQASPTEPVSIYAKDFDGNGSFDPLITRYVQGKEFLTHPRETLTDQIVSLKRKLVRYNIYGNAPLQAILTKEQLDGALIYRATTFASIYMENQGGGKFTTRPLPITVQFSPLNGMQATDVNRDGNLDLLAIGNAYATDPLSGLYDAGIGVTLLGDGTGNFTALPVARSGFFVNNDAKSLVSLPGAAGTTLWMATATRDSVKVFEQSGSGVWIKPRPGDVWAEVTLPDGKKQRRELYYGSGYLSQSTRAFRVPATATEIWLTDAQGNRRKAWDAATALALPGWSGKEVIK
ncbi:VCBS repeat-containing protein [Chryseolinea lacunae]|uniref:VCBS repeat-containing protein n=1 Tax=Chryseolinea lacunae TaxID=2801331 RepID=A0ABS1KMZ9_9BACT|nr:VCBS repeat-containing protein [Chryseolinea lacunae]MBL0739641.1 VCBS repeat-containing protein [Chryseolinea lacunae]